MNDFSGRTDPQLFNDPDSFGKGVCNHFVRTVLLLSSYFSMQYFETRSQKLYYIFGLSILLQLMEEETKVIDESDFRISSINIRLVRVGYMNHLYLLFRRFIIF